MGQLLMLSGLEAAISSAEKEEVDLVRIVEEIVADGNFEGTAIGKSVDLQTTGSIVLKRADAQVLRSACENIIRNAIRFTAPGTTVQVVLEKNTTNGMPGRMSHEQTAILSVRDRGPGVPNESLQRIFQPFFRVRREHDVSDGNGLGLAIALEGVRMHGGEIEASNIQPKGLEVTVRLPIGDDGSSDDHQLSLRGHSATF